MKLFKLTTNFLIIAALLVASMPTAFAASINANIGIKSGALTISPVTIGSFDAITLNGQDQTAQASINDFTVTDARGNAKGWSVQVSATRFTNGVNMMHDGALTISEITGTAVGHSDKFEANYISSPCKVTTVPSNFIVVPSSKGKGTYTFSDGKLTLEVWPNEVVEGTYSSTITIDAVANIS